MIIRCPKCKTGYNVPMDKIGPEGRSVRCSNCAHTWTAHKEELQPKAPPLPPVSSAGKESIMDSVTKEVTEQKERTKRMFLIVVAILFIAGALLGLSQNFLSGITGMSQEGGTHRSQQAITIDGLEIPQGSIERTLTEGRPTTLTFTGKVVNKTGASLRVPKIIVSLHDESGIELDRWPAYVNSPTLAPGEETTWVCRFFDPALDRISEHRVQFVK